MTIPTRYNGENINNSWFNSIKSEIESSKVNITEITVADSPYSASATDGIILADASGGSVTITPPAVGPSAGFNLVVAKVDSSTNDVVTTGVRTISRENEVFKFSSDGTNFIIASDYVPDVVDLSSSQTIIGKNIDSDNNTITNIVNADIKTAAGIVESKLALDYATSVLNSSITTNAGDISTNAGNISSNTTAISGKQDDVITTQGDIIIGDGSGDAIRLAKGVSGKYLKAGASTVSWEDVTVTTVREIYQDTSGQQVQSLPVTMNTTIESTDSAFSAGVFTAPRDGLLFCGASFWTSSVAASIGQFFALTLQIDTGSGYVSFSVSDSDICENTTSRVYSAEHTSVRYINSGDKLRWLFNTTLTSTTPISTTSYLNNMYFIMT